MKIFSNIGLSGVVVLTLTFLQNPILVSQNLVINEVMFLNDTAVYDQFGETPGWVELYNRGDEPVHLDQYFLSDDLNNPTHWKLPQQDLAEGEVFLIYFSGKDIRDNQPSHSNFVIDKNGPQVFLFDSQNNLLDESPEECIPANRSRGRLPNGFNDWEWLSHHSPGETNNTAYADELSLSQLSQVEIIPSHESGFYAHTIAVELVVEGNYSVHYTLNSGATPTQESPEYPGEISMHSRLAEQNEFAEIRTTSPINDFTPPESPIAKSHVLRAVAIAQGCPVSPVFTGNYFIGDHLNYPVDVVSVNTNPENLFDANTGIYVYGDQHNYVQRGDRWERPVHLEFFNREGESYLRQNAGMRIHGGGTREGAQKSLRLYARSEYGESWFNHAFFEDRKLTQYKRLILRMTMGDWSRTLFKDELTRYLVRDLEMDYQSGLPTVVFLNGEYWGIHNLSERQDKWYYESHHGVDGNNVDEVDYSLDYLVPFASEGDLSDYNELIGYLETHDLQNDEYYSVATEDIDLDNFIDQHIAQIYFANTDFPENNNSLWRSRSVNGVWRWLFYDCDACMIRPHYNHMVDNMVSDINLRDKPEWSMTIFRSLMQNEGFVARFTARFRTLTNTAFGADKVIAAINRFEDIYAPLIPEHMHRWHYPNDFLEWKRNVQDLKVFALKRPTVLNELLERYFGQPFVVAPNPNAGQFRVQFIGDTEVGEVQVINSRGQVLENRHFSNALQSQINFDLSSAPSGIYLVRVAVNNRYYTQRIVIGSQPE